MEGSITSFAGIGFNDDQPYSYREAKRLLGTALNELRSRPDMVALGINPNHLGRSAITGSRISSVWNFLALRDPRIKDTFTRLPHLTLSIHADEVLAMVTVPNGLEPRLRRNLSALTLEQLKAVLHDVCAGLIGAIGSGDASPRLHLLQRHYKSQRSPGTVDGRLDVDLRTLGGQRGRVKAQPEWIEAFHRIIVQRRSNLQIAVGTVFQMGCPELRGHHALDHFAGSWIACKPLLDVVLREP